MSRSSLRLTALIVALVLAGAPGGAVGAARAQAAWPTPIALGKEAMYSEFNEGDLRTADDLLDDVWPARPPLAPVHLARPLTWTEDPYGDAYWRFYFYALRPTSSLLWAYATTRDERYYRRLVDILSSFVSYDATRPFNRLTFDNNHAAAYRAMVLVNAYVKLKRWQVLPATLDGDLVAAIRRLGAFLAVPAHFEADFNHGFNEAAALVLIADNFPQFAEAPGWRALGVDRLLQMLENTIDSDGVEVENSPFYHVYVLGLVAEIATWAARYEPGVAPAYTAAARKMLRYAALVTQPDGYLPMLGATATTNLPNQDPAVYGPLRGVEPAFDWVFGRGAVGRAPAAGTALFPASGLFVMRAPLADAGRAVDQTFVTFDAGRYRTDHSHLDALGMTMYSGGATVLPEAGLFTYEPGVDFAYFHGTRGHNTVMVDGADQASGDATPGPSGTFSHGTWASGTSGLYPGVTHDRSVVLLRQDLVLVLDRLASAEEHDYAQLWHLPAGSHVTRTADGVSVAPATGAAGPALALAQADAAGLNLRTVTGATNPMQGWISRAYGAKTPSPALEFHRRGRAVRLATLLATGPGATGGSTVRQSDVPGGRRVEVCGPRGDYVVTVTGEGTPSQRVAVAAGCGSSAAAGGGPPASTTAPAPAPASAGAPARPSASCRTSVHVPARSAPARVLAIRYRACRPARLTVTVRRHGRVVVRRSRAVGVTAGTMAIHGIRPGRVRVTARIGSRRAVVRWTVIQRGRAAPTT
jgi:hypothetical protein